MPVRVLIAVVALLLSGCAAWMSQSQVKQTASVMDFLFGAKADRTVMRPEPTTTLRLPVRVGIAFVPSDSLGRFVPETEQVQMLNRVRDAFTQRGYIGGIEVIPNTYLRPGGGFTNLEQAARMFNVDVIALLSYDQTQFNDSNTLSVLYWTIIGAYVVHGDQFDIHTMVEATVFDVGSRKLLFRAPGVSNVKGSAALATFSEKSRAARVEGFNNAVASMIPNLQRELDGFQQRVKTDATVKIEHRPGYSGGGTLDFAALVVLVLAALALRRRPHA